MNYIPKPLFTELARVTESPPKRARMESRARSNFSVFSRRENSSVKKVCCKPACPSLQISIPVTVIDRMGFEISTRPVIMSTAVLAISLQ